MNTAATTPSFVCGRCCRWFFTVQALRSHFGMAHPVVPRTPNVRRRFQRIARR